MIAGNGGISVPDWKHGDCSLIDIPAMKLRYLLLFAATALLIDPVQIVNSAPARIAYESRSQGASQVYERANPAVVTVFAGREIGSGSIVTADGHVITNNHVVRGVSQVVARLADGRRIAGQVIATDRRNDLALIKLNAAQLPTIPFALSNTLQPGQPVIAIGSPYGRPGVMTQGTFRGTRGNGDLQSQVILEPGNSGGPLLNSVGEMIGVNKAILESVRGSNTGISIATSAEIARRFVEGNARGSLTTSPSPYASQPFPTNPMGRYSPSTPPIASLPGSVMPARPNPSWGYSAPQPAPYSTWSAPSPSNQRQNNVVVPSVVDSWQTAQNPYAANSNASMPTYPAAVVPSSPYSESYPNSAMERYSNAVPNPVPTGGARLGVVIDTRTMMIQQVQPGTAGANSGLQIGDRLLAVNGAQLQSFEQLQSFMNQAPPVADFTISRSGRAANVQVRF